MELLKTIAGKVAAGAVGLAVVAGGISWWRMDEASRDAIISGLGKIIAWVGIVALLPWATFFVIGRVGKLESNLAGGILVFMYTAAEFALLLWLFHGSISGAAAWTFIGVGILVAGVYNLFVCDWIAEKV